MKKNKIKQANLFLNGNILIKSNVAKTDSALLFCRAMNLILCMLSLTFAVRLTIKMPMNFPIFASCIIFPIAFTLLFNSKCKKRYVMLASSAFILLVIFLLHKSLMQGAMIFYKRLISDVNFYYKTNFYYDNTYFNLKTTEIYTTLLIIAFVYIISLLLAYLISYRRALLAMVVLFSPIIWMCVNLTIIPYSFPMILLIVSFLSEFVLEVNQAYYRKKHLKGDFAVSNRRLTTTYRYTNGELGFGAAVGSCLLICTVLISALIAIIILCPRNNYVRNANADIFKENLVNTFDNIRFGNIFSSEATGGINAGRLDIVGRVTLSGEEQLRITVGENPTPMLLKGYVGSVYSDNGWKDLPNYVYRDSKILFDKMRQSSVSPQTFGEGYASYLEEGKKLFYTDLHKYVLNSQITVQNISANPKYAYTPYLLRKGGDINIADSSLLINDTYINGRKFARRPYTVLSSSFVNPDTASFFSSYAPNIVGYEEINRSVYDSIKYVDDTGISDEYSDFVYSNYLATPDKMSQRFKEDMENIKSVLPSKSQQHSRYLQTLIEKVNTYLHSHAVYDLAPGKTPAGKDYVEYFLYENHKGYCTHFASAATLIFRELGIPARYVEGYVVTDSDYRNMESTGNTISIKGKNAHAWTEIFTPPFGWIPVEATPGFTSFGVANYEYNVEVPEEMQNSDKEVSSSESSDAQSSSSDEISSSQLTSSEMVSGNDNQEGEIVHEVNKTALLFMLPIGLIVLTVLIIAVRYFLVRSRRLVSFNQNDTNKAIISVYAYIIKLLSFAGYKQEKSQSELQFAEYTGEVCDMVDKEAFINVTAIAVEAKFSNHQSDRELLKKITAFCEKLNSDITKRAKILSKIRFFIMQLR